jgi:putative hydrolase of HD superfamily
MPEEKDQTLSPAGTNSGTAHLFENERLKSQIEFMLEVDKLKRIQRRTMLLDRSRRENSAEHSWHIALAVLVLSEYAAQKNLDLLQVIKLLLTHDLVEIDADDTYCYDALGSQDQKEREIKAAERIFNILPANQAQSFRALWDEFEARETAESRFANAMDRLQPLLHNYFTQGRTWQENGIRKAQVIARMQPIGECASLLWDYVLNLIDDAVSKGYLAE